MVLSEAEGLLRIVTIYAVQFRYDADPQPLGLDRVAFQQQVSQLLTVVEGVLRQKPGG